MPRHTPRSRKGAVPEVELDGSVTLYGIEDWTQIRDDPVVEPRPTESEDDTDSGGDVRP